jgi:hypothetical protein
VSAKNFTKGRLSPHHVAVQMPRQLQTLDDLLAQAEKGSPISVSGQEEKKISGSQPFFS